MEKIGDPRLKKEDERMEEVLREEETKLHGGSSASGIKRDREGKEIKEEEEKKEEKEEEQMEIDEEGEEGPVKRQHWEDNNMMIGGLEFLSRGLSHLRGESYIDNIEHWRSRALNETGLVLDLSKPCADGTSWDLSEGDKMSQARNMVRSEKHIVLVLNVPSAIMNSKVNDNRVKVNRRIQGCVELCNIQRRGTKGYIFLL